MAAATAPVRRSLAARVLASFALVVLAFALTIAAGLGAQRLAARDVATLSQGYLEIEVDLARALNTQWSVVTRLEGLVDDPRGVGVAREWLLTSARGVPVVVARARTLASERLTDDDEAGGASVATQIVGPMNQVEARLGDVAKTLPQLFGAIDEAARGGDRATATAKLKEVALEERTAAQTLESLAHGLADRRKRVVDRSAARERRAIVVSISLAALSMVVAGIASSLVRRRLAPLGRLTERAQAIAAGDRSPIPEELRAGQRSWWGGALRDEITELAIAFGAMVQGVASRDADLLRLRRRQEDIVDHLRAAVVALAADGRVEAANPAARAMLGARIGTSLAETTPALWSLLARDVAAALADEPTEPAPHLGLPLAKKDGASTEAPRVVDVRVVPMRGDDEPTAGGRLALLVVDDVTDAAVARTRALQAERLAAIGKMAAHVTHEIRNPLSSIGLNVELLEESLAEGQDAPERKRLLAAIAREVQRLSDVSEDYLRLARAPQTRPAPIDLCELVRDVVSFARPELERAGVRSVLQVEGGPIVANVDEGQLRQSLLNLIRNAREALEDGGTLTVSVSREGGAVVLRVADDGPGIEDEARARVFDPFFTTKSTGTGLGLPLTRQIVEAHGGTIACEPATPRGTCFVLRLPRLDAALPGRGDAASSAEDSAAQTPSPHVHP